MKRTCQIRDEVNNWIRESQAFDAVVDYAESVSRSDAPDCYLPEYDSGDHLHPSTAGARKWPPRFFPLSGVEKASPEVYAEPESAHDGQNDFKNI